jgi:hypothetical protein
MTRMIIPTTLTIACAAWTLTHAQSGAGTARTGQTAGSPPAAATPVKMRPGPGYYTEAQAARGREKFERECTECHTVDAKKPPRVSYGGNLASGFRAIAEKRYNNRPLYPSVYYYWKRMESEPGDDVDRVSQADKLDIVTYLLQQNGFPPGPKELIIDEAAMKGMYLDPGPGFEWLLNGRDLSGWGFVKGHLCEPEPKGCGKTDPWPEIRVENGEMIAAGKMHTLVYTQRKFKNYTFQMEQRFDRAWDDLPELFNANAGVIVFMSNIRLWPEKYALVDGRWYDFMHIQSPGLSWKETYDDDARRRALRAPNEWQDIEIIAKNGGLKAYLNGVLVSTVVEGQMNEPTSLGFQSQVIRTHWRHIRIKVDD